MKFIYYNLPRLAALSLSLLLMNFSCQDHSVPQVFPVLRTLPITQSRETPPPYETFYFNHYRLVVEQKGNLAVTEYGVLFSTYRDIYENNADYVIKTPTVMNSPLHIISEEFGEGEKSITEGKNYPLRLYVYQRAYAKLADGRVVYGDVVMTIAGKVVPNL